MDDPPPRNPSGRIGKRSTRPRSGRPVREGQAWLLVASASRLGYPPQPRPRRPGGAARGSAVVERSRPCEARTASPLGRAPMLARRLARRARRRRPDRSVPAVHRNRAGRTPAVAVPRGVRGLGVGIGPILRSASQPRRRGDRRLKGARGPATRRARPRVDLRDGGPLLRAGALVLDPPSAIWQGGSASRVPTACPT